MNRHVNNILHGIASLWPVEVENYSVNGGGFQRDAMAMRSDFKAVGNDLRKVLKNEQAATNKGKVRKSRAHYK